MWMLTASFVRKEELPLQKCEREEEKLISAIYNNVSTILQ